MRTKADRDDDLALGRLLERKDAEIDRLRAGQCEFDKCRRMAAALQKTIAWLDRLAAQSDAQVRQNRGRFDSLADACAADAKNYRSTAADLRAALDHQQ